MKDDREAPPDIGCDTDDEEDYEYFAGDTNTYDSALDCFDELEWLSQTLLAFRAGQRGFFDMLMSKVDPELSARFQEAMASLPDVKARESRANHLVEKLARDTKQKKHGVRLMAASC